MDVSTATLIDGILRDGAIRTVFQPIVRLDSGEVVGYEALTRGPAGPLERPDELFAAAGDAGRSGELDRACVASAFGSARTLPAGALLFVNVEPATLGSDLVAATAPIAAAGERTVVLEVTERALMTDPTSLLGAVESAREHGWLVALDDVGVEPGSLALLPLIAPDVIKLDMGLIRDRPDRDLGRTMAAVMAHAERAGTTVLAEGIETDAHLERAVSLGATLGQGYRFGRPADAADASTPVSPMDLAARPPRRRVQLSPFDAVVATGRGARVARKQVLLQISHPHEEQASADPGTPLLLSAFQHARHFTPATTVRYGHLAERCAITAALGVDMPAEPVPGVRGGVILPGDPLADEWSVAVLGPHYAGALLGRDLGDDGDDPDRRFEYVVTHDRDLVELATASLLRRILPQR